MEKQPQEANPVRKEMSGPGMGQNEQRACGIREWQQRDY